MEWWSNGVVEWWSNGGSITPSLHHSIECGCVQAAEEEEEASA
jgi:hypothetical protein